MKNKAKIVLLSVCILFSFQSNSMAEDDACGAVICLAGNGGSACDKYLKKYYSIIVYDDGAYDPEATRRAREKWLASCKRVSFTAP